MKKIILISIIFLITLYIIFYKNKSVTVFHQIDNEIFEYLYVYHEDLNIDNINYYLKDLKIIAIKPLINPIYKDNILIKYKNKDNFKEVYLNYLKEKGYYNDYNKYLVEPIKIDKVLVYTSIENLKKYNLKYML